MSTHISSIARTAVSFSGDILNNSESNKAYMLPNKSMCINCILHMGLSDLQGMYLMHFYHFLDDILSVSSYFVFVLHCV